MKRRWAFESVRIVALAVYSMTVHGCSDALGDQARSSHVTFTRDVAPILYGQCVACHRPGEAAPFPLVSYDQAKKRALQIADVTADRIMPPWPLEPGYVSFANERRLDDQQIETIQRWAANGAVEGDPKDLPPLPAFTSGWQIGEPDLVVGMEDPYVLPPDGTDVFHNLVIPIPIDAPHYVQAVEMRPENPKIVHHALIQFDRTGMARRRDEDEPGVGFAGIYRKELEIAGGQMLGWLPGRQANPGEPDISWRLEPGTDLVIEMHMLPSGKPEPIRCRVGFFFAKQPPSRQPVLVKLTRYDLDIAPGEADYLVEDKFTLPVDADLLSVYPHAHYLGKSMKGWATLPDGIRQWLLFIRQWDFFWQDEYYYPEPIFLPQGTVVSMAYTYDNSSANPLNPSRPPSRVTTGWKTSDEMAELWLRLVPRRPEDNAVLTEWHARKQLLAHIAGQRKKLETNADDVPTRLALANALAKSGDFDAAIGQLREIVARKPEMPEVYLRLGHALAAQGRVAEAIVDLEKALAFNPRLVDAHMKLGRIHASEAQWDRAGRHFAEALDIQPRSVELHVSLGKVRQRQGRIKDAIRHMKEALAIDPGHTDAEYNLGHVLRAAGQYDEAIRCFRDVIEVDPDLPDAYRNLGDTLQQLGRLDAAIEVYRRGLEVDEADAEMHHNVGIALGALNRMDTAAAHLERAIELDPGNADIHFDLGLAYRIQGSRPEAIRHFRAALDLRPDFAEAQANLEVLADTQGQGGTR